MSDPLKQQADLTFERWKASLKSRDRTRNAVPQNFDDLFSELHKDGIDFQTAHLILDKAVRAHMPSQVIIRSTFQNVKRDPKFKKSEGEFAEEWKQSITDMGTESFFSFYEIPKASSGKGDPEDQGPKVFGNMSEREYRLQRRHAESFPRLDTTELEKKLALAGCNPELELLSVLGEKKDG